MSIANSATCDTPRRPTSLASGTVQPAAGLPKVSEIRAYQLPNICRAASLPSDPATGWQVREDGEEYEIPDLLGDEDYEPEAVLSHAAFEHTEAERKAMGLLDDAENLLSVLLDAIQDDGDSRAMQTEAVLKVVGKKLRKAHTRVDRQEWRHRNLFLAYFDLKCRVQKDAE